MVRKNTFIIRRMIAAFLSVLLLLPALSTYAENPETPEIDPLPEDYQNIASTKFIINVVGGKLIIDIRYKAISGGSFSNGSVTVVKTNGLDRGQIKKWSGLSSSTNVFSFYDNSITLISGGKYQVTLMITVTAGGVSENIVAIRTITCP